MFFRYIYAQNKRHMSQNWLFKSVFGVVGEVKDVDIARFVGNEALVAKHAAARGMANDLGTLHHLKVCHRREVYFLIHQNHHFILSQRDI